jgi:hypothetical protein
MARATRMGDGTIPFNGTERAEREAAPAVARQVL